jgi:SHOCT-like domain
MPENHDEAVHRVLRLVAEGRLTADEAAPILDALSQATGASAAGHRAAAAGQAQASSANVTTGQGQGGDAGDRPRYARIQVLEGGRRSVDLRVPVGLGRFALSKIPGLSIDQIDEVQDALASGTHGPILDVQDVDGDGVRISLE